MFQTDADLEAGDYPQLQSDENWWLTRWSGWLASIGAVSLAFLGIMAIVFNLITLNPVSAIAGALQVIAAVIILSIEASSLVSFLSFAKPMGLIFESRPLYIKTTAYAGLTVLPMLLNPSGLPITFGFIISAAITAMYGMILIGRKGNLDDMRASGDKPTI